MIEPQTRPRAGNLLTSRSIPEDGVLVYKESDAPPGVAITQRRRRDRL